MKEEAPTKKLPPKMYGGEVSASTPTKAAHDEILSSLLRINNFDSISSIKDESLDIDLSACVTISSAGLLNGNSLSSTDFWRVLDESAQNAELNLSNDCKEDLVRSSPSPVSGAAATIANLSNGSGGVSDNQNSEFNVTFLRPEPPNAFTNSPFKKGVNTTPVKQQLLDTNLQQLPTQFTKVKLPASTTLRLKVFKDEPVEEYPQQQKKTNNTNKIVDASVVTKKEFNNTDNTTAVFSIFQKPKLISSVANSSQTNVEKSNTSQVTNKASSAMEIKVIPTYKCIDCNGLVLNGQEDVTTHEAAAHRTRLSYKCGECEREFDLLAGLKKHLKTHRTEGRKDTWKKCPDCGKCLKLGSMWMHRKIHSDNKKYVCDICGQKFVQKINLTHHARIHSSEKPYECPECQKRFQERSHLQRHQKYHAQTRSYRCEKCGKMYKTERCLKVHNLVHLEQRPFACNVCDKSFISNSKLKQHSNIHTGMRPFKCNYCPRDFTNFPNWLKHTRRRHKVDHKTGEHLENIPSYCSKKSTAKSQKAAVTETKDQTKVNGSLAAKKPAPTNNSNTALPTAATSVAIATGTITNNDLPRTAATSTITKPLAKSTRKKKQPQQANNIVPIPAMALKPLAKNPLDEVRTQMQEQQQQQQQAVPIKRTVPISEVSKAAGQLVPPTKQTKAKRERKQPMPKQVQKQPIAAPATPSMLTAQIKKEPMNDTKAVPGQFLDLHSLSLTSAEELIMEQALEMEECGLYDTPVADIGTDNAISSETAAALHFQIKNEINDEHIKEEELVPLKKHDRHSCPSLESSPFSSPASIEFSSVTSSTNGSTCTPSSYYMPTFTLNAQGTIVTGLSANSVVNNNKVNAALPTLITTSASTTATTIVNVPLLMRPNQMLPSVDTLLFSTHAGSRFFHNKTTPMPAQQNLSS